MFSPGHFRCSLPPISGQDWCVAWDIACESSTERNKGFRCCVYRVSRSPAGSATLGVRPVCQLPSRPDFTAAVLSRGGLSGRCGRIRRASLHRRLNWHPH